MTGKLLSRPARRAVLLGGAALLLARPVPVRAAPVPTPAMTPGPFYPTALPADADSDLVRVAGQAAPAQGQVTLLQGVVRAADGRPVPGAVVEIWQCDANGLYLHPRSGGRAGGRRDAGFQGYGRARSGADGGYTFRTIRPAPYSGRTPHIHVAVRSAAGDLVTQMFVAGEAANERDFLYRRLDPRQRAAVTVRLAPAEGLEPGALSGRFDLVLPG